MGKINFLFQIDKMVKKVINKKGPAKKGGKKSKGAKKGEE